ncbi:MAG: MurT ligase domain-containing protein [Gaiella sp.]
MVRSLEFGAARLVGALSRRLGRGGGTTLPGKLIWKLDPGAVDVLARRLVDGSVIVSATNGKTTTTGMVAAVIGHGNGLAWNRSGANLASGVTSTLLARPHARRGLFEIDEFALPALAVRLHPRVLTLSNLFRDQLDRYGELEHIAERWRAMLATLPRSTTLVVNGDDPLVAALADGREGAVRYGIDDPAAGHAVLQHAADSKHCLRCGAPYRYAVAYVGHLGDYRCPACGHGRPPLDVVARDVKLEGLERASFDLEARGVTTRIELGLGGLYNVYNALAAAATCLAAGVSAQAVAERLAGFEAAFGRQERLSAEGRDVRLLLIKNPAGANEVVRTLVAGGVPGTLVVALNDAIADGRDVSWIWDVDFEPLLERARHVIVSGDRAAELALRFTYAGFPRDRLEVVPSLTAAFDAGISSTPEGERLAVLPTYTAMLRLRATLAARGLVRPYWET